MKKAEADEAERQTIHLAVSPVAEYFAKTRSVVFFDTSCLTEVPMKGVIMAGGFGTRLRPLTINVPKPMVPVLNRPMMEHIVRLVKSYGVTDLISLLYFQADQIRKYFGDGRNFGVDMDYVMAQDDLGTAGSVNLTRTMIDERFLVISADVLTDIDLAAALEFHQSRGAIATILLTRVENPLAFGIVITDSDGKVTRFLEKPKWGEVFSDTINTGIYILEREALEFIPEGKEFDFSKDLFPLLLEKGLPLYGYIGTGYWKDVGTLEQYRLAHLDVFADRAKLGFPGEAHPGEARVYVESGAVVPNTVKFAGTVVIGKDCKIGDGCELCDCVIGAGSTIGLGTQIRRSVLWDNVSLGDGCIVTEATICARVKVGSRTEIGENAIIAEDVEIGSSAVIAPQVKIWPNKTVDDDAILNTSLIWGERWAEDIFVDARVTGLTNQEITPEFASKLGAAFGAMTGKGSTVVTSRDADPGSRMLNRAFIAGLVSAGANAADLQLMPIPVVRNELRSKRYQGGVYIRKSTRDPRLTDLIFFENDGRDLPLGRARNVERLFFREDFARAMHDHIGSIDFPHRVHEHYAKQVMARLNTAAIDAQQFRIVLDYDFGSAATVFPSLIGEYSLDVVSLSAYMDPRKFSHTRHQPESVLATVANIVKSLGVPIGFLLDHSAERLEMVDGSGTPLESQQALMALVELYCRNYRPKRIATVVEATIGVEEIAAKYGTEVLRVRNDHLGMMNAALVHDVSFVGGSRGGYIFPEFGFYSDGMFAILKVLEMLALADTTLSNVVAGLPKTIRRSEWVPCPWKAKGLVMRRLIEETEGQPREVVDGVRLKFEDGVVLIIPHGEKPAFYLFVEGKSPQVVDDFMKLFEAKIKTMQK